VPEDPSLTDVYSCAVEALGGPDVALDWLTTPNEYFEGEPPLLHTNRLQVIGELGRIAHGVF
jgi:Protein of unknown function (DUF2384)